jgi:hypothetical protein
MFQELDLSRHSKRFRCNGEVNPTYNPENDAPSRTQRRLRPPAIADLRCQSCRVRGRHFIPARNRLRARRTQPPGRKPGARNGELRPAAIQADVYVRRRCHGRMTKSSGAVAIEPDFRWDFRNRTGLTLRADHSHTSGTGDSIAHKR